MELVLDCPYCGATRVGFSHEAHSQRPTQKQMVGVAPFTQAVPLVDALMRCRQCERCVVVVLAGPRVSPLFPGQPSSLSTIRGDPERNGFSVESVRPQLSTIAAPNYCPEEIAADYKEALQSLRQKRAQSAGMMFRRVLEQSVREIAAKRGLRLKGSRLSDWLKELKGSEPFPKECTPSRLRSGWTAMRRPTTTRRSTWTQPPTPSLHRAVSDLRLHLADQGDPSGTAAGSPYAACRKGGCAPATPPRAKRSN